MEKETKKNFFNETKTWFFEKISKIDKTLPRLIRPKSIKTKNFKWKVTNNLTESKKDYK